MDYFRSLLGQKPTPLAAFRNNPANRNESQRRRVMLNQQRAQRIINNNVKKANAAQKARWANQVSAANAARQLSEPTRKANPRFNPTLEAIAESNNNLPIPAAAPNGANQRARNAAEVALPENQNNIIKAQRKAARNEPNIWNMNEGRSFFQGPNAIAKISPAVSPAVNPSGYPLGVVSSSRKNKRFVTHNTTPGLARAQAANARKRHVRLLPNVGSNQNKKMPVGASGNRFNQSRRGIEARAAQAQAFRANPKLRAAAAVAALPPSPELVPLPSGPSGPSSPLEVPVLPGRSNLGLGPPGFLGAVPSQVPPPLPPKRSYPNNQGAAAAAAFARELNEAAAATPPAVPAAPPAVPQFNGSVRGTNLERANAENQPKPRKQFIVAPYQNNMSALGQLPPAAEGSWNNAINLAGREIAANPFPNTSPNSSRKTFNMSQANKNAKAAANARVASAKVIYAENKYAREQEEARLKRNINAMAYVPGGTNLNLGCTPCQQQIVAKLDTLLDRSKPSTLVSNALASGKKTIQSAIEATLVGIQQAMEQGTAGATAAGTAVMAAAIRTGKAVLAAGKKVDEAATNAASELLNAARIARNCVKGAAKGTNRSQKCAAAYAAVQNKLNELKMFLSPPYPPLPWPISLTFPKINYFTLKNANGKTQFNRNVNRTRGALGRFGTRISTGLGAFGKSLKNASSRASSALSRGTLSTRNYLSGRTKQRNSILRFIKRSYYNRGIKNIAPDALERWTRELVATGMSADDARIAVINVLGGLNMGPNGKVTATNTGPVAKALGVAGAPGLLASPVNNPALQALLAPPEAGLVAPQGLNALGEARRLAAAKASGAPLYTGSSSGGKRSRKNRKGSRKNRKGSRKNRKNRKGSRKH